MTNEPVERFNVHETAWTPFPEFGGREALLHRSADGSRMAASFRLSGRHSWTLEYDDFFYVIAGHANVSVDDRETFDVAAGDFCRLRRGMSVTFDMSDDFHEVSVLIADGAFDHTEHPPAE